MLTMHEERPTCDAPLGEKLRHDFKSTYFRVTAAYTALMATLILVATLFQWRL